MSDGFKWTEGPTWDGKREQLYFSDIPNNRIHSWSPTDGLETFLSPAGQAVPSADPDAAPGTNGLLYLQGDDGLLMCNQTARSIGKIDLSTGDYIPLATEYEGKPFNSPNDLILAKTGNLYFTDPPYGLKDQETYAGKQQAHNGVYRLSPTGDITLISDQMSLPNGIALSPDDRTLYVAQSDPNDPIIRAFRLKENGDVISDAIFHDFSDLKGDDNPGLPDGMAVDRNGFIFATGPGGVSILSPDGKRLGRIYTGRATANCAFGGDGSTLFMTAHDTLLSIITNTYGMKTPDTKFWKGTL